MNKNNKLRNNAETNTRHKLKIFIWCFVLAPFFLLYFAWFIDDDYHKLSDHLLIFPWIFLVHLILWITDEWFATIAGDLNSLSSGRWQIFDVELGNAIAFCQNFDRLIDAAEIDDHLIGLSFDYTQKELDIVDGNAALGGQ